MVLASTGTAFNSFLFGGENLFLDKVIIHSIGKKKCYQFVQGAKACDGPIVLGSHSGPFLWRRVVQPSVVQSGKRDGSVMTPLRALHKRCCRAGMCLYQ